MLEITAVLVVVALVLYNMFGDKIKAIAQQASQNQTTSTTVDANIAKLHKDIDSWIALRRLPSVCENPQAIQAMELLKSALLKWENIEGKK